MTPAPFILQHQVFFNETNAVGGVVYFSNYVKWQGIAREKYFLQTCPDWPEIMKAVYEGRLNMITVEEHSYFIHHAFFGDELQIELSTGNIRKFSFEMYFVVKNQETGVLMYEGMQKLAFDDFKGKYLSIPDSMRTSVLKHAAPADAGFARIQRTASEGVSKP